MIGFLVVRRISAASPAARAQLTKERDGKIIRACRTLMQLLKIARQLLRRKHLPAEQLVRAVRGLAEWPDAHESTMSAVDIATMISQPGADATATTFAIVGRLHAVTPEKAKRLLRTWQSKQTRARTLELR